jgi:hypothetical protein
MQFVELYSWLQPHKRSELRYRELLSLRGDRPDASPPLLWGRIKEGGRAVLRDKGAAPHSTLSSVCATPHPTRPHKRGRVR